MADAPHHIHLNADARPYACHTPADVPRHWEREVKKQLDVDVRKGVPLPVLSGESTMVCDNGGCGEEVWLSSEDCRPSAPECFLFTGGCVLRFTTSRARRGYTTVTDVFSGFHQEKLDEASSRLTTIITPWGWYRYLCIPMGHCAAPDAYTKCFDDATANIPRKVKCVDDTLLFDSSVE